MGVKRRQHDSGFKAKVAPEAVKEQNVNPFLIWGAAPTPEVYRYSEIYEWGTQCSLTARTEGR